MRTLNDIKIILHKHKPVLVEKYGIKTLGIFGSYARNEQEECSDVDILVDFNQPVGIEFIDLAEELESILGTKVDLVSKKGIKKDYFKFIEKDLKYV